MLALALQPLSDFFFSRDKVTFGKQFQRKVGVKDNEMTKKKTFWLLVWFSINYHINAITCTCVELNQEPKVWFSSDFSSGLVSQYIKFIWFSVCYKLEGANYFKHVFTVRCCLQNELIAAASA